METIALPSRCPIVRLLPKASAPPPMRAMANAAASRISLEFGLTGAAYTIATACSSSNHAIGQAFWAVRNGSA